MQRTLLAMFKWTPPTDSHEEIAMLRAEVEPLCPLSLEVRYEQHLDRETLYAPHQPPLDIG